MAIAFVQKANSGTPSGTATSKTATFSLAQTATNTNFVVIQYGNASGTTISQTVSTVTDSSGNTYTPSTVGFIAMNNGVSNAQGCVVYYCSSIASHGTGNVVTVTISGAVSFFCISILEYSGLTTSSALDVSISATASSPSANQNASSNAATTTNANDLLLGVFSLFDGVSAVGSGYTSRDNFYTCLVEEQIVSATSSYSATATSAGNAGWTAQMLAFKATSGAGPQTVSPSGIASSAAFGSATITSVATISPAGIPSSVAFGSATLTSVATISPSGIPSSVAFGTATIGLVSSISPSGIASTVNFGLPSLTLGTQYIYPSGIPPSVVFGNTAVSGGIVSASHLLDRWFNPRPWLGLNLGQSKDQKLFIHQLVDILVRLIALTRTTGNMNTSVYDTNNNGVVDTCDSLAWSKLTGTPNIAPGALAQLSISNAAVTTSQTIDCTGYAIIWINYTLTGAISFTTTLNNLSSGAQVYWRVLNASGATRTLTLAANSPSANPYSVVANVWAGIATWSSGALVNNNAYGSIAGTTSNVGSSWLLYGNGVNG